MNKSYHYLEVSNVNLFFLPCGLHNESVVVEFKHVCDNLPSKLPCCAIFRDMSCNMATVVKGQIANAVDVLVERFNGTLPNCEEDLTKRAAARCRNFLKTKYYKI
jgi:hypothetical protein